MSETHDQPQGPTDPHGPGGPEADDADAATQEENAGSSLDQPSGDVG